MMKLFPSPSARVIEALAGLSAVKGAFKSGQSWSRSGGAMGRVETSTDVKSFRNASFDLLARLMMSTRAVRAMFNRSSFRSLLAPNFESENIKGLIRQRTEHGEHDYKQDKRL